MVRRTSTKYGRPNSEFLRRNRSGLGIFTAELRKLGKEMSLADSLIAATAVEHDLTIVTTDSGFEDRGLKLYDPLGDF